MVTPQAVRKAGEGLVDLVVVEGNMIFDIPDIRDLWDVRVYLTCTQAAFEARRITREYSTTAPSEYTAHVWREHLARLGELQQAQGVVVVDTSNMDVPDVAVVVRAQLLSDRPEDSKVSSEWLAVGLMSGTSVDGIDTALVKIRENTPGSTVQVELVAFETVPFQTELRDRIFQLFEATATLDELCRLNFEIGSAFAQAVVKVASAAQVDLSSIDFVGSHGQTIRHLPNEAEGLYEA